LEILLNAKIDKITKALILKNFDTMKGLFF